MSSRVRVGLGLEFHSSQHADLDCEVDFIEYGLHSAIGIPAWVLELRGRVGADLTLHPLDVNFSADEILDDAYLESLGHEVKISGARALVSRILEIGEVHGHAPTV